MEWGLTLVSSFVVLLLLGPLALLAGGVLGFVVLGHLVPTGPAIARTAFDCPFAKRRVTAEFLSWAGSDYPTDVDACSAFPDPRRVRCPKACLHLAETHWVPSPMVARFALIAGGVSHRNGPTPVTPGPESPPARWADAA